LADIDAEDLRVHLDEIARTAAETFSKLPAVRSGKHGTLVVLRQIPGNEQD